MNDAHRLPLADGHLHELSVESGIPLDLIAEEGIRSLAGAYQLPSPADVFRHPNVAKARRFGKHPNVLGPGIMFPVRDPLGRLTYQFKPDRPRLDDKGKARKYESAPGCRLAVHVPLRVRPHLQDTSRPLFITEGVKKILAGVAAGLCIVGLMGVDAWSIRFDDEHSAPLPDWDHIALQGRLVYLCFDSDVSTKASVGVALKRLSRFLESCGATVVPLLIPDDGTGKIGLDDFLVAGGSVDELIHAAMLRTAQVARRADPPIVAGGDGSDACLNCRRLEAHLDEMRSLDAMVRTKVLPVAESYVVSVLLDKRQEMLRRMRFEDSLYSPKIAELANVSEYSVSRLVRQWKHWQTDPEISRQLPFTIITERADNGHTRHRMHVRVLREEPPGGSRAVCLGIIASLPRPEGRQLPGGHRPKRLTCPDHPGAAQHEVTTVSCTVPGCRWRCVVSERMVDPDEHDARRPVNQESQRQRIGGEEYRTVVSVASTEALPDPDEHDARRLPPGEAGGEARALYGGEQDAPRVDVTVSPPPPTPPEPPAAAPADGGEPLPCAGFRGRDPCARLAARGDSLCGWHQVLHDREEEQRARDMDPHSPHDRRAGHPRRAPAALSDPDAWPPASEPARVATVATLAGRKPRITCDRVKERTDE